MATEIFDVNAALQEHPESEVAEHLATLHGVDRNSYLKDGLTDSEFLKEYGAKNLPVQEAPQQEATPNGVSNATNAMLGTALAAYPQIAGYGAKKAGEFLKGTLGLSDKDVAPTKLMPPDSNLSAGQKYKSQTGYGAGKGETVREVVDEFKNQNKPIGSGKLSKKIKGPMGAQGMLNEMAAKEAELAEQARIRAELLAAKNAPPPRMTVKEGALRAGNSPTARLFTTGYNLGDLAQAQNPFEAGVSAVGAAAPYGSSLIEKVLPKKYQGLARAAGPIIGAAAPAVNYLERKLLGDQDKSVLEGHAAGGAIQGYAGGKLIQKAAHELGGAPKRVTDWLQHHIDKFIVPTQSDRMGGVGGPSFSANSLMLPQYKGLPWGSGNEGTTTAITNLAKDQRFGGPENQIFMPLLGSLNQHQSNQIVFDRLKNEFYKNADKLPPEALAKINGYMQRGGNINPKTGKPDFDPFSQFDIRDKGAIDLLGQSFENRGLIAKHGFGGENTGGTKSQVMPYQKILDSMADPLVQGAPTFALGPRAFSLSGGVHPVARPDLNKAFPYLFEGQDLGHTFNPVPNRLIMPDFQNQWRLDKGKTTPLKSGELPQPGYYENTLGYKLNKNDTERIYPRQQVTEQLLDTLYKEGHAEGGPIQGYAGGGKLLNQVPKVAQALEEYLKGNISNAERIGAMRAHLPIRKWSELPPNYTDEQIRNALMVNKQPKALADVPAGAQVGNRLDIPAYTQNGVYVDTVHDANGKPISYNRTGHLTGVDFSSKPNQAVRVGLGTKEQALTPLGAEIGSGKSPFALMKGTNVGTHDEEVRRMMQEYLNDPKWTQVGMDPRAHSQFFDKSTGMPIWSAEQKLQSGPLVMVPKRGLETTHWDDPRLSLTDFPGKKYAGGGLV